MEKDNDILAEPVSRFVAAVAAKTPTPGGGSVAGVVGALAAALGEMTLNFTIGKKKFAQYEQTHSHLAGRLERSRRMFLYLVADDIAAYGLYCRAVDMPENAEKEPARQLALAAAINVPREMAKLALAVMRDLLALSGNCNTHLISDLVAGAALAVATLQLCDYNVRVNVPQLNDAQAAADLLSASTADVATARSLHAAIEQTAWPQLG